MVEASYAPKAAATRSFAHGFVKGTGILTLIYGGFAVAVQLVYALGWAIYKFGPPPRREIVLPTDAWLWSSDIRWELLGTGLGGLLLIGLVCLGVAIVAAMGGWGDLFR